MIGWVESLLVRLAHRSGFRLERMSRSVLRGPIPQGAKLYVGCGEQNLEGYFGCDLRPLPHVQLACRAWEVSKFCSGLSEIYSRHMLEHLTFSESQLALRDWKNALAPGGLLRIEVPNLQFAMSQWQNAVWTEHELENRYSNARWGYAGLFGWQRECDPEADDYNLSYWDVHKSGYTADSMSFFLEQAGFGNIQIQMGKFTPKQLIRRNLAPNASDDCHLIATGIKPCALQKMAA